MTIYTESTKSVVVCICQDLLGRMDESLCSILVSNLIKNAYLHSADGAAVDIRIEGNVLTVINDGVSPLDEKHIFERFYQGRKEGSTGLGLALVKAITDYYRLGLIYYFENGRHHFGVSWR